MLVVSQLAVSQIEGRGRSGQVEQQLESAIRVGLLTFGDRLPPEQVLAEQLGVSPLTLRQSLAALRSRGLIETRRGRGGGSYVKGQILATDGQVDEALVRFSSDQLRDLGDHAGSVAAATARLAAERTDEQDIQRLQEFARQFAESKTASELRRTDSRLHIGIGVASQSPRLTAAMARVYSDLAPLCWGTSWVNRHLAATTEHAEIIDAISRRDGPTAESIAVAHFANEADLLIDCRLALIAEEEHLQ
jgi:GntR family transcriptional repressor for pyruvate dehydrogenase complex